MDICMPTILVAIVVSLWLQDAVLSQAVIPAGEARRQ